jgi:hypothetical protein
MTLHHPRHQGLPAELDQPVFIADRGHSRPDLNNPITIHNDRRVCGQNVLSVKDLAASKNGA